jgi:hypothetical protein
MLERARKHGRLGLVPVSACLSSEGSLPTPLIIVFKVLELEDLETSMNLVSAKNPQVTWVLVAHTCNPSYSGGRDQEDQGLGPDWADSLRDPI